MDQMITEPNLLASGQVTAINGAMVVFNPAGTRYQWHLIAEYAGAVNVPVKCIIRAVARKVYTVPSGGNFVAPILGTPRIVQGRVQTADETSLVVHAGCPFHIRLPGPEDGIDLDSGPIYVGRMVNVVCLAGARAEFIASAALSR